MVKVNLGMLTVCQMRTLHGPLHKLISYGRISYLVWVSCVCLNIFSLNKVHQRQRTCYQVPCGNILPPNLFSLKFN